MALFQVANCGVVRRCRTDAGCNQSKGYSCVTFNCVFENEDEQQHKSTVKACVTKDITFLGTILGKECTRA